jgi:hypothetical protein
MQPTLRGEEIVMLMVMPTFILVCAWGLRLLLNFIQQRRATRYQYDIQSKLLEKFGTAPELLDYLKSDAGVRFLETSMSEPRPNPQTRILGSMQNGIVLTALGVGFMVLRPLMPAASEPFAVFGVLSVCVGTGFLASSWMASNIARRWGLISRPGSESDTLNA